METVSTWATRLLPGAGVPRGWGAQGPSETVKCQTAKFKAQVCHFISPVAFRKVKPERPSHLGNGGRNRQELLL